MTHQSANGDASETIQGVNQFPRELLQFFTGDQGRILLVRGDPGAGKTLLAVRALDVLRRSGREVLYASTRVDADTVYRNYLADETRLTRSNVLDISQDPFAADISPAEEIGTDRFDPEAFLEWLRTVSEVSGPLTVAFDSWELVRRYLRSHARKDETIEPGTLVTRMAALARCDGLGVILVTERADRTDLDYVVDGVVELRVDHGADGRPERKLVLEKLRGVRIGNRTRPFTLSRETFRVFTPVRLPLARRIGVGTEWQAVSNTKATFSTGIADLDAMLDGGYSRGSVVHFGLGSDLSRDAWSLPCLATAQNFLSHGMGVAVVPPPESSPGLVRHDLEPTGPDGAFEARCDVFRTYDHRSDVEQADSADPEAPSRPGVETAPDPSDTRTTEVDDGSAHGFSYAEYLSRVESLRGESDGPLLHVISVDAAGDGFRDVLSDHATYAAVHNDLSILVTKPGGGERTGVDRIADVHLRLERRGEAAFLYGKNPVTPFLGVDTRTNDDVRNIALREMV